MPAAESLDLSKVKPSEIKIISQPEELDLSAINPKDVKVVKLPTTPVLESTLRGAAQGASFGFADEAEGAFRAVKETALGDKKLADIVGTYGSERDIARAKYEKAREDNPAAFTTGEVGGTVVTSALPVFGAARGLSLLGKLGRASLAGGVQAAGLSTADLTKGESDDFASDVTSGALTGAATQGALSGAGAVKRGAGVIKDIIPENISWKDTLYKFGKATNAPFAPQVGWVTGATVDKFGPKITEQATKTASTINSLWNENRSVEGLRKLVEPLISVAKQGDPAAMLTFQMLDQSNPDLIKALQQEEPVLKHPGQQRGLALPQGGVK